MENRGKTSFFANNRVSWKENYNSDGNFKTSLLNPHHTANNGNQIPKKWLNPNAESWAGNRQMCYLTCCIPLLTTCKQEESEETQLATQHNSEIL